eukprot:jgi/Mesvir1/27424/Mv07217-RA.1
MAAASSHAALLIAAWTARRRVMRRRTCARGEGQELLSHDDRGGRRLDAASADIISMKSVAGQSVPQSAMRQLFLDAHYTQVLPLLTCEGVSQHVCSVRALTAPLSARQLNVNDGLASLLAAKPAARKKEYIGRKSGHIMTYAKHTEHPNGEPTGDSSTTDMPDPNYRLNVGICLVKDNKVFLGKRREQPWSGWQMPQGGVDDGEDVKEAALRELFEETGVKPKHVEILAELPQWLSYDFPPEAKITDKMRKYKGQTQRWYLMRFLGTDSEIDIHGHGAEFSEWKWASMQTAVDEVIPFKKAVCQKVADAFIPIINREVH